MKEQKLSHNKKSPIGIFDSGIGGLTVLREIRTGLPHENIVYFGDTARVPYGTKSRETITRFSTDIVSFLNDYNTKLVIVACNTASSLSLEALKRKFTVPIIGVIEPGAREALSKTKSGRIGVIGTKATISSGSYENALKAMDPKLKVFSQSCPLFVPFVEEGWLEGEVVNRVAKIYLGQIKSFKVDTLILGCTHYPLLSKVIQKALGDKVKLVNSAEATAREAKNLLEKLKLKSASRERQETLFFVSDEPEQFRSLGERFLGRSIQSVAKVGDISVNPPKGTHPLKNAADIALTQIGRLRV